MGKESLRRYAESPTIGLRQDEESGGRMWAHATPPGLRPRQTPACLTPVVFLRVDSVKNCGETPHADWVMCPITIMVLLGGETFGPELADIHTQDIRDPLPDVRSLGESAYDVRHIEGATRNALLLQLLGDVRVGQPALHDQESRARIARRPASSLWNCLLFPLRFCSLLCSHKLQHGWVIYVLNVHVCQ